MVYRTLIYICVFLLITFCLHAQETSQDTSGYISGDIDYNLIYAADKGYITEVERLLKSGADVNATLDNGVTPLMYATEAGNFDIVKILVQNGANINKVPLNGITALQSAVLNDSLRIAEYLIRSGADINLADNNKVTPLMQAIADGNYYMTDMILYYGADYSKKDAQGTDAMMLAAYLGLMDIAGMLIDYGADVNSRDNKMTTPLMAAVQNGYIDMAELLINNGVNIDDADNSGITALGIAVTYNDIEMTRYLISMGANVNVKFSCAQNVLTIANENRNDSLVNILKQLHCRTIIWPEFSRFIIGWDINWNTDDFLTGIHFGISDRKYNIDLFAAYQFRPFALPVLIKENEFVSYQFREKRGAFSAGIDKKFNLIRTPGNSTFGIFAGINEILTFGSYRGSVKHPETHWLTAPRTGFYLNYYFMNASIYYEYMNLNLYRISNNRIIISFGFNIDRCKSGYKPKSVFWL